VLEQVLNYTTTGDENGGLFWRWVSGKDGTHKCVMTSYVKEHNIYRTGPSYIYRENRTVDLRQINPDGFRIRAGEVGDEKIKVERAEVTVMERLQKAWGLALAECPPAVRKPF